MNDERPLRILQFIEGGVRYGAAVSILSLLDGLKARNLDVRFAAFKSKPMLDMVHEKGIPVIPINARKRYDLRGIMHMRSILKEEQIDVIHTHLSRATFIGTLAAKLSGVPSVSTVHGMNKKFSYMMASHIITVSEAAKQHLVNQGVSPSKITAVYNGIDMEDYASLPSREEARAMIGEPADAVILGTVSRVEAAKGLFEGVHTVAKLRADGANARYLIVGDGSQMEALRALAKSLGVEDSVRLAGFQPDVKPWLRAMDIFLFLTKIEAFGISLIEAAACSVPIVTSKVGGVPEVLDDSCALFANPGSPDDVALQVQKLIKGPETAASVCRAAHHRVSDRFSVTASAEKVEQIYRQLVAQHQKR